MMRNHESESVHTVAEQGTQLPADDVFDSVQDGVDQERGTSPHSDEKDGRPGRNSSLAGRSRADDEPGPAKQESSESSRSLSMLRDEAAPLPQPPLSTHAPANNVQAGPQSDSRVQSRVEFDRRFDGPYARPSMSMTRRKSSQHARLDARAAIEAQEPSIATTTTPAYSPPLLEPEPPPLNYTLRTRKMAIIIFWTVIIFDSVVMPVGLYFGLWYGVGPGSSRSGQKEIMSANTVFTIVTAAIGGASIVEYFVRFWRLYKKGSTCRVIGARRWYLDAFHWNYTLAWVLIMIELVVATDQEWPPIRLVSMPLTTMLYTFGTELILLDTLRLFRVPAPFRISSIPKGSQLRPCLYTIIEDICAVDGSGGTAFREALNKRYEASHIFRSMLRRLGIYWSIGAEGMAVVCTVLIFTISDDAAYAVGWSVPFAWAGLWTLCTIWYVQRELSREKAVWVEEAAKSAAA